MQIWKGIHEASFLVPASFLISYNIHIHTCRPILSLDIEKVQCHSALDNKCLQPFCKTSALKRKTKYLYRYFGGVEMNNYLAQNDENIKSR